MLTTQTSSRTVVVNNRLSIMRVMILAQTKMGKLMVTLVLDLVIIMLGTNFAIWSWTIAAFTLWKSWRSWSHNLIRSLIWVGRAKGAPAVETSTCFCRRKNIAQNSTGSTRRTSGRTLARGDSEFCFLKMAKNTTSRSCPKRAWKTREVLQMRMNLLTQMEDTCLTIRLIREIFS